MATPTNLPASFTTGQVLTSTQQNDLRGAFRVLQVVSATKTDTFTLSSSTFTNVTGMSVTITPQSASNKILVIATGNMMHSTGIAEAYIRLARGGVGIAVGDASLSRPQVSAFVNDLAAAQTMIHLDNPATTSATTYTVQIRTITGATQYFNRTYTDNNGASGQRSASSITVMEISA